MYIPKNRIKTNLYTSGNEFMLKSNNENYTGFYHSLWDGKFFTGKTQNDLNLRELTLFQVPENEGTPNLPQNLSSTNVIALFLEDPDPIVNKEIWNQKDIVTYLNLQGKSTIDDNPQLIPFQYYPTPNAEEYVLGTFTRYFCVKLNQPLYTELNKETYEALVNRDQNYLWQLYKPFKLQWTLIGKSQEVYNTNRNIVLLAEKRQNLRGLGRFLKENYLKFYR
tara:strand:+ start:4108 stop:4773 length:666 start_codon:yes stop_codon:yes gene_type:complete